MREGGATARPSRADVGGILEAPRGFSADPAAIETLGSHERGRRLRRLMLAADLFAVATGCMAVAAFHRTAGGGSVQPIELAAVLISVPLFVALVQAADLYHSFERHLDHTLAEEIGRTVMVTTAWAWSLLLIITATSGSPPRVAALAVGWVTTTLVMLLGRGVVRRATRDRGWYRQRVVLAGYASGIAPVLRRIQRHPELGIEPVSVLTRPDREAREDSDADPDRDEGLDAILAAVRSNSAHRVVLAGWTEGLQQRTELLRALSAEGVFVDVVSGEPEALGVSTTIQHVEGLPIMTVPPARITPSGRAIKRAFDITAAGVGLLALAPVCAYVAIRIKLDSSGPVLFRQVRSGRGSRRFRIVKFRTMVDGAEKMREGLRAEEQCGAMFKLADDPRVTRYGARLRASSIDELPQLWNVLRGEMSLVGPRPLPPEEAELAGGHLAERLQVRPGITGPWQIHGRSDIPFEDMVKLDYSYVSAWSMREDLRLLTRTVSAVLSSRGAY